MVLVEHVDSHASSLDTGQDAVSAAGGDFVAAVQGNRVNRVLAFVLQVLASVEAADITCVIVDGTDTGDELAFVRKRRGVHQEHRNVLFVAGKECLGQSVAVPARQNQSVNALVDEVQAVVQLRGSIGRSVGGDAGPTLFLTCGLESVAHRDIERILERVHRKADGQRTLFGGLGSFRFSSGFFLSCSFFRLCSFGGFRGGFFLGSVRGLGCTCNQTDQHDSSQQQCDDLFHEISISFYFFYSR